MVFAVFHYLLCEFRWRQVHFLQSQSQYPGFSHQLSSLQPRDSGSILKAARCPGDPRPSVSWRPTPIVEFPQLGFFGNCKATGRSQPVRHSENVRKEVPAPPTLSRVPLKGTGRHGVSTNRTLTQPRSVLAAGGSHLTHFTPDFPV